MGPFVRTSKWPKWQKIVVRGHLPICCPGQYLILYDNRQQSGKRPRGGGFWVEELEILEEKSVHFSMKMVSKESGVE